MTLGGGGDGGCAGGAGGLGGLKTGSGEGGGGGAAGGGGLRQPTGVKTMLSRKLPTDRSLVDVLMAMNPKNVL